MEITSNVHLIEGVVALPYLIIDPTGLTLIDAGMPFSASRILRFIQKLGFQPDDLDRIIITHSDIDHIGGLEIIRSATKAKVYTSPIEAEAIRSGEPSRRISGRGAMKPLVTLLAPLSKARPSIVEDTLEDGQVLPLLGGLQVIYTPGHTPGHISLYSPSTKILFSGDSFLIRPERFIPSYGFNNWDSSESIKSYQLQAELHSEIVCGGHGWTKENIGIKFSRDINQ